MATSTSTMKSFMNALEQYKNDTTTSGIAILDHAVRAVSRFNSLQDAVNNFVKDVAVPYIDPKTQTKAEQDAAKKAANERLKTFCGIELGPDNKFDVDTGAVSGKNAGNKTLKDAQSIVPEKDDTGQDAKNLDGYSLPTAGSLTTHTYETASGKTCSFQIQWPQSITEVVDHKWQTFANYDPKKWKTIDLNDYPEDYLFYLEDPNKPKEAKYIPAVLPQHYTVKRLKESIETITKGMYHWWAEESAKLAYDSYGVDFNGKILKVDFMVNRERVQVMTYPDPDKKKDNDTTPANEIRMTISLPLYGGIDPKDVNGKTRVKDGFYQCYMDRTFAHEMIHAVMLGNGTFKQYDKDKGVSMPEFFTEGIAELVMGLDDFDSNNTDDILAFALNQEGLAKATVLASGTGTGARYTSGYMFLRYLCEQGRQNNPSAVADVFADEKNKGIEYYDKNGKKLEGEKGAVITTDGRTDEQNPQKKVIITGAVDEGVRIDLTTDAKVEVTDKTNTGKVIFTLSGSLISGVDFDVEDSVITDTGDWLKVLQGDIKTSDPDGKFYLETDGKITTTFGDGRITINDVPFDTDTEAGAVFKKRGRIVEAELVNSGVVTVDDGFTFEVEALSEDSKIAVYVDESGSSHVTGLVDGDKVIVTKGDLTATYAVDDEELVVECKDGTSTTKTSYPRGEWDTFNFSAIWDGTAEPVVGAGLTAGSVVMGGTELNTMVNGAMLDAQGNVTTDGSQAVATIKSDGKAMEYKAMDTSKPQELIIYETSGVKWNIDNSDAKGLTVIDVGVTRNDKKEVTFIRSVDEAVNVTAGSGTSGVVLYSDADSSIQGGAGNLTATVGGKGNHHLTAGSGSRNVLNDFGSGENVITGGSGKNTFQSNNGKGTLVAGSGQNIFKTTQGITNKIEGYTYGMDEVSIGSAIADYNKFAVGEGTINYDGKDTNGEVDVSSGTGTGKAYMVTMADSTGHKTRVGWTGEDGGTVDASSETQPFVLIGNQNKDARDILIGGTGNDVIFAGENDIVRGGAGKNEIHLLGGSCRTVEFGTAGARDEVAGFMTGFDESDADTIYLMDASVTDNLNLKYDGKEVVLKGDSASMKLADIQKSKETKAAELLIGGNKVAAIEKGTTATVSEADYADIYFGIGSAGVDFGAVSDDLTVDLSDNSRFKNIKSVTGGKGNTILMGGIGKATLASGGGNTSLWGGSGNALMVGAKDAKDEFFFSGESGRDTISGFEAGTEDTSDVLNLFGSTVTGIKGTDKGVEISTSDTSRLRIQGIAANDKLQWESGETRGVAKIGSSSKANTFTYDDEVTNYFGGNKKDTLKVSGVSNSVWMENLGSSIEIIDASSSTGDNVLAGGLEAETIMGGRGDNSLWGGAGGNDVLEGGSGYNEFYFGKGEGTDTVTQSNNGDKVMLYNVKLEDVNGQATGLRNGNMVIALNDGSSLTLKNYEHYGATTFQLADGTFNYDRNTDTWQEKK